MYQKIAQIFLYKYNFSVLKSVFINGTAIIFTFTHLNLRQLKSYSVHLQFSLNFEVLFAVKHCAGYTNYQGDGKMPPQVDIKKVAKCFFCKKKRTHEEELSQIP